MGIPSSPLARWGGAAASLGGISYGLLGYLHNPDTPKLVIVAVVPVLEVTTPALFLGGLVGLHFRLRGGGSRLERTGVLLGLLATVLGVVKGIDLRPMPLQGEGWWALLYAGLSVVGVATLGKDAPRLLGALVLASGTLGWVSLLTDPAFSDVLVPMRLVHVAFAALFCLSCVVWGGVLFSEAS